MRQVIVMKDTEGDMFIVEVPSLPGCFSEGKTVEEALANIRDAIRCHVNDMIAAGEEVPARF